MVSCRLYLITPPRLDAAAFSSVMAQALDAGDVAAVQLRLKDVSDDDIRQACDILRPVVQAREAAFLLNDRADLAAEMGCDGVHVGQSDCPYLTARRLVGDNAIVGVTCHASRHLAIEAAEAGADYVAFGAFFPTATKVAPAAADPEILEWWSTMMTVPCVAIGGLTVENCAAVIEAGADFLAVSAGVWDHPEGAAAAVRAFNAAIERVREPAAR
ncbi:Thiamine-phosphate synthase [Candidatus Defluviicoccus seviourii]|uniref:Thiamine-phosphate synthase n=1 Tax=Candidatus Defluviicoccus seviourii TaxID=2565273 RepID=A0A564WIM3_9PROT|nr:Thiamine-phosphate synthase [Candidatus Defluviicoccus seviourii]